MAYQLEEAKKLVIQAGLDMIEKGLIARTWGNISGRISESQFVITPSGRAYESLTPDQLVVVNIKDASYEGDIKPSSETGLHARVYSLRPDADFLIHTHQTFGSAVGIMGKHILPATVENATTEERAILGECVPCSSYGRSATPKLAKSVAKTVGRYTRCKAVLMRYHGVLCIGKDWQETYKVADALESLSAKVFRQETGEKLLTQAGITTGKEVTGGYVIHTRTPYVMYMSHLGKTMYPYLDDVAQIAGTSIRCITKEQMQSPWGNGFLLRHAMKNRDAVFIKDRGGYCYGKNREEAEALSLVLEKACQAAYVGLKTGSRPIDAVSAGIERRFYVEKYAARKDK